MIKHLFAFLLFGFGLFVLTTSSLMSLDLKSIQGAWLFDENKGNEVADISGNNNTGKFTANDIKWVNGKFDSALLFFGGGKVVVPHADGFTTPTFTIMAWINVPKIPPDWGMMLVGKDGWPNRNYAMYIALGTGQLHFAFCAPGQQDVGNMNSNNIVADGKWRHVAMTYDLKMRRIFIGGVLDKEGPSNAKPSENMVDIEIGRGPVGTMDEVLIANKAFSEEDIKRAVDMGLKKLIIGGAAVSASYKLTSTWGSIKGF